MDGHTPPEMENSELAVEHRFFFSSFQSVLLLDRTIHIELLGITFFPFFIKNRAHNFMEL